MCELRRKLVRIAAPAILAGLGCCAALIWPHAEAVAQPATSYAHWTKVAYQAFRNGNWEILVADGDGNQPVNVTNHGATDANPELNVDASQIVFNSDRDGNSEIYVMNVDGSGLRRLTFDAAADTDPAWSPDGKHIVFVSDRTGNPDIIVMDTAGGNQVRVSTSRYSEVQPTWTSDRTLAWSELTRQGYGNILSADITIGGWNSIWYAGLPHLGRVVTVPGLGFIFGDYDLDSDGGTELVQFTYQGPKLVYDPGPGYLDLRANAVWPDGTSVLATQYEYTIENGQRVLKDARLVRIRVDNSQSAFWLTGAGPGGEGSWASADSYPPKAKVELLPIFSRGATELAWDGGDYGPAGIAAYDVDWAYLEPGYEPNWHHLLTNTVQTSATFRPESGYGRYLFRARAIDQAGHKQAWDDLHMSQAQTVIYATSVSGQITDNRGVNLADVRVLTGTDTITMTSTARGQYAVYLSATGAHTVAAEAQGFGVFPPTTISLDADERHDFYLPPLNDKVTNGSFEAGLEGWSGGLQVSGSGRDGVHSGERALGLVANCTSGCTPGDIAASMQVTLTDLVNPTLAFYYSSNRSNNPQAPIVTIQIDNGITVTTVYTGGAALDWTHAWVDLSAWQGQPITLTFRALTTVDPYQALLFLDDVSVGSWTTPVIERVEPPGFVGAWEGASLTIHGSGFTTATGLRLGGVEVPVQHIDGQTLIGQLPTGIAPGVHDVIVHQGHQQATALIEGVTLGSFVYLPALNKDALWHGSSAFHHLPQ